MRGDGMLTALGHAFDVLARDVAALVESEVYKRALTQCLLDPYDRETLIDFLALDNVCRDIRLLVGAEDTAVLWEARKHTFDEVWRAVVADVFPGGRQGILEVPAAHGNRKRLRDVLLNVLAERTPGDVYEHIEMGLK